MRKLIALLSVILWMFFSNVHADVVKQACTSAFGMENEAQAKSKLLALAKKLAIDELFGSFVKSFTKVKNFSLQRDEIETYSSGFIRIKGNPVYAQGKNFGGICVKVEAYVTPEDSKKMQPKQLSKKTCVLEGDLKTIKKRAEKKAKKEALFDFDQNLKKYPIEKVLPLLREVKFSEGDYISGTPVYCVKATGLLYPIELAALKVEMKKPVAKQFVQGLKGEYFNLRPFSDSPGDFPNSSFKRTDKAIDFEWGYNAPASNISADYFGVKWTGMIYATITGPYLIQSSFNRGGIKLSINDSSVIERWNHCTRICTPQADIYLEGDKWYLIQMEYFHVQSHAHVKLLWRKPGDSSLEIIPATHLRTEK
jgi:hypothetical protein